MPGLVGCVSDDILNPALMNAMAEPMLRRSDYSVHEYSEGHFGITLVDLASDIHNGFIESKDKRYALYFLGSLYEPWASSKAEMLSSLMARWIEKGWRGLADLNGEYLVLVWDRLERSLVVVNDRLGLYRFHYWFKEGVFAWASEVKSLAAIREVDRSINEQALAELLTFGHTQDGKSLLKSVHTLPPATCLIWKDKKCSLAQYWKIGQGGTLKSRNPQEFIDGYEFYLRQAVSKRLGDFSKVGIFLSGGLDSRAIAGALQSLSPDLKTESWTTGHGHDHDTQFAKQVSKVLGSKHTSINIPKDFLSVYGKDYAALLDGTVSSDGCHRASLIKPIDGKTDVIFNGFLGDVLGGSNLLEAVLDADSVESAIETGYRYYALGVDEPHLQEMFLPEVYNRIVELPHDSFAKSVKRIEADHPAARLGFATIERQRSGDARAQLELLGAHVHLAIPFTDRDLFDFASRLPLKWRVGRKAYIQMISRKYPRFARVPRAGDGLPLIRSKLHASFHWRWLQFERHFLPKLSLGLMGGHPYGDFVHCDAWIREASQPLLQKTLVENQFLNPYFKTGTIKQIVERFMRGGPRPYTSKLISSLVSFAAFVEDLARIHSVSVSNSKKVGIEIV